MRPLLLLDADGVLMPLGRAVPPGYERCTTASFDVVVCRQHGAWLRELAVLFDIVWATTWGQQANDVLGGLLGLPEMPVLELGELPRAGTRKLAAVASQVGGRALAWIDDELYDDAVLWAEERDAPTLLVRTAPHVGMAAAHVAELQAFARSQPGTAGW